MKTVLLVKVTKLLWLIKLIINYTIAKNKTFSMSKICDYNEDKDCQNS